MQDALGLAVIGLGTMGQIHVRNIAGGIHGARLVAMADPDLLRGREASGAGAQSSVFGDFRQALDCSGVDAVIVASSTSTHGTVLREVLARRLPVLCEKPLAASSQEALSLHRAFKQAGIPLQIGFMRRFDPSYRRAFELVSEGKVGTVYHYGGISRDAVAPSAEVARCSGGFMADTGVHEFDMAAWLLGARIDRVFARGGLFVSHYLAESEDVDLAHVSFITQSGTMGLVELSRNAMYGYDIRTEVLGSKGAVRIGVSAATGTTVLTADGVRSDHLQGYMSRFQEAYRAEVEDFVSKLREGGDPAVTGEDGLRAVTVAEAAERSLRAGREVEVIYAE